MLTLKINGKSHNVDADPDMPLLWALRDLLGMNGTKFGCGVALCGACTVHLDGSPRRACVMPVSAAIGHSITTIEAISTTPIGKKVQQAWLDLEVIQCGYCQSGQIMAAAALLETIPAPTDTDIDEALSGNIWRCRRRRIADRLASRRAGGPADRREGCATRIRPECVHSHRQGRPGDHDRRAGRNGSGGRYLDADAPGGGAGGRPRPGAGRARASRRQALRPSGLRVPGDRGLDLREALVRAAAEGGRRGAEHARDRCGADLERRCRIV